jgi:hypothetical protein
MLARGPAGTEARLAQAARHGIRTTTRRRRAAAATAEPPGHSWLIRSGYGTRHAAKADGDGELPASVPAPSPES